MTGGIDVVMDSSGHQFGAKMPIPQAGGTRPVYVSRSAFTGGEENEISVDKGEVVFVIDKTTTGWWHVERHGGETGYVPSHYLRVPTELMGRQSSNESDKENSTSITHSAEVHPAPNTSTTDADVKPEQFGATDQNTTTDGIGATDQDIRTEQSALKTPTKTATTLESQYNGTSAQTLTDKPSNKTDVTIINPFAGTKLRPVSQRYPRSNVTTNGISQKQSELANALSIKDKIRLFSQDN